MIPRSVVPNVSGWGRSSLVANMVRGHPGLVIPDDLSPSLVPPASYQNPGMDCLLARPLLLSRVWGKDVYMYSYPRAVVHSFVSFLLSLLSLQFLFLVSIHFVLMALAKAFGVVIFILE